MQWKGIRQQFFLCYWRERMLNKHITRSLFCCSWRRIKYFEKNAYFIQIMYITLIKNYLTYIGNVPWVTISILRMMIKSGTAAVTVQLFHSIKLIRGLYYALCTKNIFTSMFDISCRQKPPFVRIPKPSRFCKSGSIPDLLLNLAAIIMSIYPVFLFQR